MGRVIIGLGSNIEPDKNIQKARDILAKHYVVLAESSLRKTKSIGDINQADFINGAVLLETELNKDQLKFALKDIESDLGRNKDHCANDPRTIDLDIVVWDSEVIDNDFYQRAYLKELVLELMPELKY